MGGAFNPPHTGHVGAMLAAKQAAEKKQLTVIGGFMAIATDGYVRHKGRDWAIPAVHRIAMCNAASAESGWLCTTKKVYGSAQQLAYEYKKYDPNVVVVHAKGGDKGRNRRKKNKSTGNKCKDIEFFVARGAGADKNGSNAMLSAVKPGLSSTAVREHLLKHPGEPGVRELVERGWLSAAVAEVMITRASVLRTEVPRLFGSPNSSGGCRDAAHDTERAKDAPKTPSSSSAKSLRL